MVWIIKIIEINQKKDGILVVFILHGDGNADNISDNTVPSVGKRS